MPIAAGKLVASCAIACGVLVLALPITIIVDNFMRIEASEELQVCLACTRAAGVCPAEPTSTAGGRATAHGACCSRIRLCEIQKMIFFIDLMNNKMKLFISKNYEVKMCNQSLVSNQ